MIPYDLYAQRANAYMRLPHQAEADKIVELIHLMAQFSGGGA